MQINKILPRICLLFLFVQLSFYNIQAQCTDFNGGPYTNLNAVMPGGIAPCDPNCGTPFTIDFFEVWSSEAYIFYGVIQGNSYTVDICTGPGAGAWDPEITVGPSDGAGGITGVDANIVSNCSLTFTATTNGDYLIIINEVGTCGGLENNIDNGFLTVQCNGTASCTPPTCGAMPIACDPGEDYCSCSNDCPCPTIVIDYIDFTSGDPAVSTTGGFAYCAEEAFIPIAANPVPEKIYVPLGITTTLTCVSEYDMATSNGVLSISDGTTLNPAATVPSFLVFWLELTQADVTASGGMVTITITDGTNGPGGPSPCNSTLVITINSLNNFNTDVATTCPGICGAIAGSVLSFDCATNMVEFEVTDAGSPPAGSNYELFVVNDPSVAPVTITGVSTYMLGPIDPTVTYSIGGRATGGGATDCNVQTGAVYPDCYTPAAGCLDLLAGVGDMEGTWTEVSDTTNTTTAMTDATAVPIIDGDNPLADAQSAFLGGWGGATRTSFTSIEQMITFGAAGATVNLIFWIQMNGCDSADDMFTITIDGNTEYSTDALSAYPMTSNGATGNCGDGQWYEITIPLGTTYSDGAPHTVVISATEAATNGSNTNFFVDEMIIESCIACPPEYTLADGNRLTGTESGTADYETDGSLESEQTIDANAVVDYDSAIDIQLFSGFNTQLGALFHAFIDGCMGAMFAETEKIEKSRSFKNDNNSFHPKTKLKDLKKEKSTSRPLKHKVVEDEIYMQQ